MRNDDFIVEIQNMHFMRADRKIFDDVTLRIARGKITAVMGPSGTGKTTLLRLISGLLRATAGTIKIDAQDVGLMSRSQLLHMRREMGMLFQSGALFTSINVFDNIAFPLREHTKLSEELIYYIVMMKLQAVGLRGAHDLMPRELSGGMARRVALARAMALDPKVILYDEPFAGQDPIAMGVLLKLIRSLNDALSITSVVVSHDLHETLSIADYIYVIAGGRVIGEGTPEALRNSASPAVQQFIQGLPDGPVPFHYPSQPYLDDLLAEKR